jgi:cell division cycle 2-like
MSSKRSRWDEEEDEEDAEMARKKKEKEEKKKAKLAKKTTQVVEPSPSAETPPLPVAINNEIAPGSGVSDPPSRTSHTPSKRRRISPPERTFPLEPPEITGCRSVEIYEKLNHIEEGSYGVVYRARDKQSGDIVALKRLKLEREKTGFPITGLREISTLMAAQHPNIVHIREIVMGDSLSQYDVPLYDSDGVGYLL